MTAPIVGFFKARFAIEWAQRFPGYSRGQRWNGWDCPYFVQGVASRVCERHYDGGFFFDDARDAFVCWFADDPKEQDVWSGMDIQTEDGIQHVYPIGAGNWIWDSWNSPDLRTDGDDQTYYDWMDG